MKKIFILFMFTLILLFTLISCNNNQIELYDHKTIRVPHEISEISEEDINLSIQMRLREKEITVPKIHNANIVEENDVVTISIFEKDSSTSNITLPIGDELLYDGFDNFLLGKEKNSKYTFKKEDFKITFAISEISSFAEELTDVIAQTYFDFSTKKDFEEFVRKEIAEHRTFEYKYEYLLNYSNIEYDNSDMQLYIEKKFNEIEYLANEEGEIISEYIKHNYNMNISEYKNSIQSFYKEFILLENLMRQENIDISENGIFTFIKKKSAELNVPIEEIIQYNSEEEIRYQMYYEMAFKILK